MIASLLLTLAVQAASPVPNLNVEDLCSVVANQNPETDPAKGTRFHYQTLMFRAAGVRPGVDSPESTREKMQLFWNRHQHELNCNLLNSTVDGHILRLAMDRAAREFVNDVVRRWRLDLNHVDPRDGTTALDWIEEDIRRHAGTPRESGSRQLRDLLIRNGARPGRELR
jgi:hypothetical protein